MTASDRFERDLESWLLDVAAGRVPSTLHAEAIQRLDRSRQRPRWLVALRGGAFEASATTARRRAMGLALVVLGLTLALVVAAVVGALRTNPVNPLGRSGVIIYSVFENKQRAGQTSLTYQMNADGSGNRQMANGTCPTFSKDGRVTAYRSNTFGQELLVGPADASSVTTLPILLDPNYRDLSYALSPDGTQVAWFKQVRELMFDPGDGSGQMGVSKHELWVTPVAGGPGVRIVPESLAPAKTYALPVWSPDGGKIAFEGRVTVPSSERPSYRSGVYVVESDGSHLRQVTMRPLVGGDAVGLSWSPDGRSLAYLGLPDGVPMPPTTYKWPPSSDTAPDVFVIGADGSGDRNVTDSLGFESRPAWSPDGAQLAYLASQDGVDYRLAAVSMDGSGPTAEPIEGPASEAFTWSPDGTHLLSVHANAIGVIDAGFQSPLTILVDVSAFPQTDPLHLAAYSTDYESCAPSWRSLEP